MLRRVACVCLLAVASLGAAPPSGPDVPSPPPSPNPEAERVFAQIKGLWRQRSDVPYLRYGALIRYLHDGHVFDNWWDAYYRTSDGAFSLMPLVDPDEDRRRLGGVPFSVFGLTIFDTNPDAEPIRIDPPRISPVSSFGIAGRVTVAPPPSPSPSSSDLLSLPAPPGTLRQIAEVQADTREYQVDLVGNEELGSDETVHLKLTPLRDPDINRLRDVWADPDTFRTIQLNVQGLLSGEPYDKVLWTVRYVEVNGRNYVQQIYSDGELHFGLDTTVPKFEFDFVDFHFPTDVPQFTFDRPF
jgi:hypothetical protein